MKMTRSKQLKHLNICFIFIMVIFSFTSVVHMRLQQTYMIHCTEKRKPFSLKCTYNSSLRAADVYVKYYCRMFSKAFVNSSLNLRELSCRLIEVSCVGIVTHGHLNTGVIVCQTVVQMHTKVFQQTNLEKIL